MSKVITAQETANLIEDGVTLGASTQGLSGWAEEIAIAIEERFKQSGHPRNITLVHSRTCGDYKKRGTTHLGHEGLTKRLICGHTFTSPNMIRLIEEDKIECYLLPQAVICQLWRAIAGKKVGVINSVGLGTFVDPRIDGGKITSITREGTGKKFVQRVDQITFSGEYAKRRQAPVLFITERGVFSLASGELTLTEIAPGVDLEKDILGMMDFQPRISPELRSMDKEMFMPKWGLLKGMLDERSRRNNSDNSDETVEELVAAS